MYNFKNIISYINKSGTFFKVFTPYWRHCDELLKLKDIKFKNTKISYANSKFKNEITIQDLNLTNKKEQWIKKIEVLTGFSGEILQKKTKELPKMDMGFIDGHHAYEAEIHDFYAFLQTASENFYLLFDDYNPNENRDVTKVIDEEVVPNFDVTLIN